jgi:hypothetical protein
MTSLLYGASNASYYLSTVHPMFVINLTVIPTVTKESNDGILLFCHSRESGNLILLCKIIHEISPFRCAPVEMTVIICSYFSIEFKLRK